MEEKKSKEFTKLLEGNVNLLLSSFETDCSYEKDGKYNLRDLLNNYFALSDLENYKDSFKAFTFFGSFFKSGSVEKI